MVHSSYRFLFHSFRSSIPLAFHSQPFLIHVTLDSSAASWQLSISHIVSNLLSFLSLYDRIEFVGQDNKMVAESWFRNFWKLPLKHVASSDKALNGVLAFEIASLMSKLVHLWQSLSDKQISRLREDITNCAGIKKLVSEDEDFIAGLICSEMMESTQNVAKSVARLAKKCTDPGLKSFDSTFGELVRFGADPLGWEFGWKKMDRKVKKMERFISVNASLFQEMEILADLEQTFKRMKCGDSAPENLLEFQKKVSWKQREVKNLREISLWNWAYDYSVLLLARSLFTIYSRIKHVFGVSHMAETDDLKSVDSDFVSCSHSVSAFSQSLLQQSETSGVPRFASGPIVRYTAASGPLTTKPTKMSDFLSGPLGTPSPKSGPMVREKNKLFKFHSGPFGKLMSKTGPLVGIGKAGKKMWRTPEKSPIFSGKKHNLKHNQLTQVGPFKICMFSLDGIIPVNAQVTNGARYSSAEHLSSQVNSEHSNNLVSHSTPKLLDAPPDTLGAACLALHYANVIIVIERFLASPHLIGDDARDDLYNMLPSNVRVSLKERLKPYAKNLGSSSVYDPVLAKEWSDAMSGILEWLAPLAHNMIKWQSERSYEQQSFVSRANITLAQTLYFANQQKTEATITELLVGLNYVWRFVRELNTKAMQECAGSRNFQRCMDPVE